MHVDPLDDENVLHQMMKTRNKHCHLCRCVLYCGVLGCFTITSVCSVLIEAPKPLLIVQPEPSQIFRGETVTLTCDIQGDGWKCNWECGDKKHNFAEKELKITVESEQKCRCYGCRDSLCSQWSDNVTLALVGE